MDTINPSDLPPLSALYPTTTSTTGPASTHSTSCGGCYDVFYLSMVGVVGRSSIDTHGSPIATNEAVSLTTMTQEIGTITVDASGNVNGHFSSNPTEVIPSPPADGYTVVDGTTERYGSAYLSALSTIVPSYTSWQTIMDAGICIETSQIVTLESTATFLAAEMSQNVYTQIFGSAIATRLPRPTCTSSVVNDSTTRPIPTFKAAVQTATTSINDSPDTQIATAAKIGLSIAFALSTCLILGFLAFILWKRHKTATKHTKTTSSSNQHRSASVTSQSRGSYGKVRELSAVEAMAESIIKNEPSWKSYWRAPIFMLGGILAGMALALGHHFLYAGINMQPVDDIRLSQAWVIRFGTLLAFLVKLSFAITVATSFVQLQWLKLRQKPRAMKEIDALSSILGNILNFFDRTWLRFRGLTVLATIFWLTTTRLLPLLPVLTPGTLNVKSLTQTKDTPLGVPKFTPDNYTDSNAWGSWTAQIGGKFINFTPSFGLAQVYMPAAIGSQIFPIVPQFPNQTFHLDFFGPSVNCSKADENVTLTMTEKYGVPAVAQLPVQVAYQIYYSWVGGDEEWLSSNGYPMNVDLVSTDAARLFVMVTVQSGPAPNVTINGETYWIPRIIECSLYNASYNVDFIFRNSEQTVNANVTFLHNVPTIVPASGGNQLEPDSYTSLMAGLGSLLVGSISVDTMDHIAGTTFQYTQAAHLSQIFLNGDSYNEQMGSSIEEMFRNMTLSLVTSRRPYFTANQTIVGSVTAFVITYTYDPLVLFLSYGIALVLTLLCAAAGFYAFMVNDGSYQNIFSTFLRTTKDANLIIENEDTGRDPRPKNLSAVTVKVTPGKPDIDTWLQHPAQRSLLVRQPELDTAPAIHQQEDLRQCDPARHDRPSVEVVVEQGESDGEPETIQRHHAYASRSDSERRQEG